MKTQKIIKTDGKIIVACDYREKKVINALKTFGAHISESPLSVGDFIVSDQVVIERKDHPDFVSSIIDGRLFDQARIMKKEFEKPVFIIEGSSNRNISINALKAAMSTLIINYGASVISTKNPKDTALTIYWIANKEQIGRNRPVSIKIGKKSKDLKKLKEQIISGIPGINSVISKRLLDKFGSIEGVFSASEDELKKVRGIGEKMAHNMRNILSSVNKGDE